MNDTVSEQGWVTRPLIEVASLQRGHDLPVQDRADGSFPIFAANGPVGFHNLAKCDGPGVVTGRSGTIGKVHFVEGAYWPLNTSLYVTDFHGNDPKWVYYMLHSFGLERFAQGAGVPTLNRNLVHGEPIRVPPLFEQRHIAAILDQADALRAKRRQALAQLDSLTQSIFVEMFGDPRRLPLSWPLAPLKALGRVTTGRTPPSSKEGMFGGAVPFITPGDLEIDEPSKRTLTEEGVVEVNPVRAGASLVCCIGTIGKMGMAKVRSAFNQQINAVDWYETVDDAYGLAALRFLRNQLTAQAASTTVPILNKSAFEKFKIQVPPLSLQQTFATRIQAVESLKATHRAALAESNALFASLQHRAFAGQLSAGQRPAAFATIAPCAPPTP